MMELMVLGSASGEADTGAGVSSGTGSGSCFLFPLTLITVSTVACADGSPLW